MPITRRNRAIKRYLDDPFYFLLMKTYRMTPEQVIKRSVRRTAAILKVAKAKDLDIVCRAKLDNPFIESHAWKYLARQVLRSVDRCRTRSQARSTRKS